MTELGITPPKENTFADNSLNSIVSSIQLASKDGFDLNEDITYDNGGWAKYYEKGDTAYFRSDLLPGQVLLLPGVAGLIDHYSAPKGGNPSILSALWRYFQMDPEERSAIMEPVVQMLTADLEIWISAYAEASPVRIQSNGTSVVSSAS